MIASLPQFIVLMSLMRAMRHAHTVVDVRRWNYKILTVESSVSMFFLLTKKHETETNPHVWRVYTVAVDRVCASFESASIENFLELYENESNIETSFFFVEHKNCILQNVKS